MFGGNTKGIHKLLFSSFLLSGVCSYKKNSAYFYFENQLLITDNVNNGDVVADPSSHLLH